MPRVQGSTQLSLQLVKEIPRHFLLLESSCFNSQKLVVMLLKGISFMLLIKGKISQLPVLATCCHTVPAIVDPNSLGP